MTAEPGAGGEAPLGVENQSVSPLRAHDVMCGHYEPPCWLAHSFVPLLGRRRGS